jgi:hypothetical protein
MAAVDPLTQLADPNRLMRAIESTGRKEDLKDYMVAVSRATGEVVDAWAGTHRRISLEGTTEQYPVKTLNRAAARRLGAVLHQQRGRRR